VGKIEMRTREYYEPDDTRLILLVPVACDVPSVLDCFNRYLERWIPITPPDAWMRITVIWSFRG
jgi:hypothetical protein